MKITTEVEVKGPVFIRTVTYHYTGEVVGETENFFVLKNAAWIADSGRWGEALKTGNLDEVEAYPDEQETLIAKQSVVEILEWKHPLPRETK